MDRILQQELARVARNGEFAIAHTIINQEDIDFSGYCLQERRTPEQIFADWMHQKQMQQFAIIQQKEAMTSIKNQFQNRFFSKRKELNQIQKAELDKLWIALLSKFDELYIIGLPIAEQIEIHKVWNNSIQNYLDTLNYQEFGKSQYQ